MNKKVKIFDIIIFNENFSFLNLRIKEFYDVVDYFIIIPKSEESEKILKSNSEYLIPCLDKTIFCEKYVDDSILKTSIQEIIEKVYLSFDDLIFFSREDELPNFRELSLIEESIKFNPTLLSHLVFCWNIDYLNNIVYYGSFVFSFTQLLTRLDIFSGIKLNKNSNSEKVKNGCKFENFHEPKENERFFRENLLSLNNYNPATTYQLVKRDFEIPENFNMLVYNKIGRNYMKKHLFYVDSSKELNLVNIKKLYNSVSVITFSNDVNEVIAENIGDEVYKSVLFLPDRVLYDNNGLKEFQEKYKKNEIKKIIHTVFPLDQDLIRIVYKDFNDIEKTWLELKNETFSEIINPS